MMGEEARLSVVPRVTQAGYTHSIADRPVRLLPLHAAILVKGSGHRCDVCDAMCDARRLTQARRMSRMARSSGPEFVLVVEGERARSSRYDSQSGLQLLPSSDELCCPRREGGGKVMAAQSVAQRGLCDDATANNSTKKAAAAAAAAEVSARRAERPTSGQAMQTGTRQRGAWGTRIQ